MSQYTLSISIDEQSVEQFYTQGWHLCFASGVSGETGEHFNVVAYSTTVAGMVTITWQDEYAMAASTSSFNNGDPIVASTAPASIDVHQSYTLPADWENGTVQPDATAPRAGFKFINQAKAAAAIVYKKINGNFAPIYISADSPLPPGSELLTPIDKVAVWFSECTVSQTANMVSQFDTTPYIIDFTSATTKIVIYNGGGVWSTLT